MNEKKWVKYLLCILIPIVVVLLGIYIFLTAFKIKKITVEGCDFYSKEQIISEVVNGFGSDNSVLLRVKNKFTQEKVIPFIEKYDFEAVDNHTINIHVYEKSMVGCVKYMNEYLYIDKDGNVLESSDIRREDIIYFTGIKFEGFELYEPLKVEDSSVFSDIAALQQLIKRYEIDIDSVHFSDAGEVSMKKDKIKIILGKKDFYDEAIAALSKVLPQVVEEKLSGKFDLSEFSAGDNIIFKKTK
ncbi:MAG: cell division protein FtsQ/DivIB [Lachnospiraceae bacterium]|nr:cell division protein FtsQ/DivIB [Lachnospiraceae bacterium]